MILYILSIMLFVVHLACADDFAAQREEVLALGKLMAPPAMMVADVYDREDSQQSIYFDALDYKGKPTKVFAWLGIPEKRAGKVQMIRWGLHIGGERPDLFLERFDLIEESQVETKRE